MDSIILETVVGDIFIGRLLMVSLEDRFLVIDLEKRYHPTAGMRTRGYHDFLPDGMVFMFGDILELEVLS